MGRSLPSAPKNARRTALTSPLNSWLVPAIFHEARGASSVLRADFHASVKFLSCVFLDVELPDLIQIRSPQLLAHCDEAMLAVDGLLAAAKDRLRHLVEENNAIVPAHLDREQRALHALAWFATTAEALRQTVRWARDLERLDRFHDLEQLIVAALFGEYLAQLAGGIPMSQLETARASDIGLSAEDLQQFVTPLVREMIALGTARESRAGIAVHLARNADAVFFGDPGLDETMDMIRGQFFRFAQQRIAPQAQRWHL